MHRLHVSLQVILPREALYRKFTARHCTQVAPSRLRIVGGQVPFQVATCCAALVAAREGAEVRSRVCIDVPTVEGLRKAK